MTVEYNSTRRDIAASYWYNWRNNSKMRWYQFVIFLLIGGIFFLPRALTGPISLSLIIKSCLLGIGVLVFLALYPQLKFKPQRRMLTIDNLGISTTIGVLSAQIPWEEIDFIRSSERYVFIIGKNMNAFVIPERAFSSQSDRKEFFEWCRKYLDSAQLRFAA